MIFNCPHCDQELEVEDEGAGLTVPCPNCSQDLVIPEVELLAASQDSGEQPDSDDQSSSEENEPEPAPDPAPHKPRKGPSTFIRWALFILILLGIGTTVYFSFMAPGIIPGNEPMPQTTTPSAPETAKPEAPSPPADSQQ